jgi:hypothetical protein
MLPLWTIDKTIKYCESCRECQLYEVLTVFMLASLASDFT